VLLVLARLLAEHGAAFAKRVLEGTRALGHAVHAVVHCCRKPFRGLGLGVVSV
jgi:hypothetical protein